MSNNPKISVVLPVYNGARYLREAIESILNQTFSDFEFIIIDDGSTDDTPKIFDAYNDVRIIRVGNERHVGLVASLNYGLEIARGEFIARMDSDDVSYPERFERQIRFLEENSSVGVLGTNVAITGSRGKRMSVLKEPPTHELIHWKMLFSTAVIHPAVMMRREIVVREGGYNPAFIGIEDTELWTRLIIKTKFANLQEILLDYRLHSKSISSTRNEKQHRQGIMLRQRLCENIMKRRAPEIVAEWFSNPNIVLAPEQVHQATVILAELYAAFRERYIFNEAVHQALQDDFDRKISIADAAGRDILRKHFMRFLRKLLPNALRHRIRTSRIGRCFGKRVDRL